MNNMASIISSHNRAIPKPPQLEYGCNCRTKTLCPLENKCLTPKIIYEAEVTNNQNDEERIYIGLAETSFKDRFRNHTKAFNHKKYQKDTELSKYVWNLKDQNKTPVITWRILKRINSKPAAHFCTLCLSEKLLIIKSLENEKVLNKKSELISNCRHQNKNMLNNVKDSKD